MENTYRFFLWTLTEEEVDELEDDIIKSLWEMRANARWWQRDRWQEFRDEMKEERWVIDDDIWNDIS